jgi:hypothetical protein
MKGRLVAFVGVFCIAMLIASGAYAGKPTKEPKSPHRPGNIAVECIEFTGDLTSVPEGGTVVEGCCPNAGPAPEYKMILEFEGLQEGDWGKEFEGQLFAKPLRIKEKGQSTEYYIIHFCTWDVDAGPPAEGDYFFDIRCDGDDIQYDETTDVLTVTVVDEPATVWVLHNVNPECDPSIYPYCENPCADGVEPNCDPSDNPTCYHPCNEDHHPNVSFTMTKTTDLSNCPVVVVE